MGLNEGNVGRSVCPGFWKSTYGLSLTKHQKKFWKQYLKKKKSPVLFKFLIDFCSWNVRNQSDCFITNGSCHAKTCLRANAIAKVQISLRISAVWLGSCQSAYRIIGNTECMNEEQRPGWYFTHAQDDLNLLILRMFEGTFSLGETKRSWGDGVEKESAWGGGGAWRRGAYWTAWYRCVNKTTGVVLLLFFFVFWGFFLDGQCAELSSFRIGKNGYFRWSFRGKRVCFQSLLNTLWLGGEIKSGDHCIQQGAFTRNDLGT